MDALPSSSVDIHSLLLRVRVAREGGQLPASLADDLQMGLYLALPTVKRREVQANYLRSAAKLLDGTPWQRAEQLADLIRCWTGRAGDQQSIHTALYRAATMGLKLPTSARQLYRIITATDI